MKAYRNLAGNVIEIEVDVDPSGSPILPPDTTVDEKPVALDGHYVTVVGTAWVQIPIPQPFVAFETKKQQALDKLLTYRAWYLDQPVEHAGSTFDADELARNRLTQALVINQTTQHLPPAWVDANNQQYPITAIADLQGIVMAVQTVFSTRFFEMDAIRQQILAATDETALDAVVVPSIPSRM